MSEDGGLGALLGAYKSDSDEQDHSPDLLRGINGAQQGMADIAVGAEPPQPVEDSQHAEAMQVHAQEPLATERDTLEGPQPPNIPEDGRAREPKAIETASAERPLEPAHGFDSLPSNLQAPPGECDPETQARVARWLELQREHGRRLTDTLRASRDYRNPEFFRKMVEYWEIDEHGTAFPPGTFDPGSLPEEDNLDSLKKEWAIEEERRRAARAAGTARIDFTRGAPQPTSATAVGIAAAQAKAAALAGAHGRR